MTTPTTDRADCTIPRDALVFVLAAARAMHRALVVTRPEYLWTQDLGKAIDRVDEAMGRKE